MINIRHEVCENTFSEHLYFSLLFIGWPLISYTYLIQYLSVAVQQETQLQFWTLLELDSVLPLFLFFLIVHVANKFSFFFN